MRGGGIIQGGGGGVGPGGSTKHINIGWRERSKVSFRKISSCPTGEEAPARGGIGKRSSYEWFIGTSSISVAKRLGKL